MPKFYSVRMRLDWMTIYGKLCVNELTEVKFVLILTAGGQHDF